MHIAEILLNVVIANVMATQVATVRSEHFTRLPAYYNESPNAYSSLHLCIPSAAIIIWQKKKSKLQFLLGP